MNKEEEYFMVKPTKPKSLGHELVTFIQKKMKKPGSNCKTIANLLTAKKGLTKNTSQNLVKIINDKMNKKKYPPVTRLELMLTENCNLNCEYCFISFKNKFNRMTELISKKSIDFLLSNSKKKKKLGVFFMGGEPLLEFDLIKATVDYAKEKLKNSDKKIAFSMTTNGTLFNDKILSYMKKNKITFMLSLDGTKKTQDMFRKLPSGAGSYDKTVSLIPLMKKFFPSFPVRVTPMPESISELFENIKHLSLDLGLSSFIVGPATNTVWNKKSLKLYEEQMLKVIHWIKKQKSDKNRISILNLKSDSPSEKNAAVRGCMAGRTSFTVTTDGNFYPCSKMLGLNKKQGIFRLGSLSDGITEFYNRMTLSGMIKVNNSQCKKCLIKKRCTGGCYASNFQATGDIFSQGTQDCKISTLFMSLSDKAETVLGKKYFKKIKD
jgi:uncharacterized protein